MPIYTYECEDCGVRFDARQKFSDEPVAECPECGGHTHRVPQPVGIVFKGGGWYVKDSRGQNNLAVSPNKKDKETDSGNGKAEKSDSNGGTSASTDSSAAPTKDSK